MNMKRLKQFVLAVNDISTEEDGQDLVEYAFLLAFLGIVAVAMLQGIGVTLSNMASTFMNVTTAAGAWGSS